MIHHPATQTTHHSTRQPTLQTLRKRKNLVFNDASSRCQFNSLAFTHDNENIVALAGTPEWSLVVWRWAYPPAAQLLTLCAHSSPPPTHPYTHRFIHTTLGTSENLVS